MSSNITIVNPLTFPEWDTSVQDFPKSSIFHTKAWAQVLHNSYDYTPCYFTLFKHDSITATLPIMEIHSLITGRRGVSLPFSDYCAPLYLNKSDFRQVYHSLFEYGKKSSWKYLETHDWFNEDDETSSSFFFHKQILPLINDAQSIYKKFKHNVKTNIKKAIRENVEVHGHTSENALKEYYQLHCIVRKKHGIPPQPYRFFKMIYEHIISKNLGQIILAKNKSQVVAGGVFFHVGKKAYYKFSASNMAFQHLRANNLIIWEAIQWYAKNGFQQLCFGRTDTFNKGLYRFKASWGALSEKITYHRIPFNKNGETRQSYLPTTSYKVFKILPSWFLKIVGSLFYKHMG